MFQFSSRLSDEDTDSSSAASMYAGKSPLPDQMCTKLDVNLTDWLNISPYHVKYEVNGECTIEQDISSNNSADDSVSSSAPFTPPNTFDTQEGLKNAYFSQQSHVEALFWGTSSPVTSTPHSPLDTLDTTTMHTISNSNVSSNCHPLYRALKKNVITMRQHASLSSSINSTPSTSVYNPSLPATPRLFSPLIPSPVSHPLAGGAISPVIRQSEGESVKSAALSTFFPTEEVVDRYRPSKTKNVAICAEHTPTNKSNISDNFHHPISTACPNFSHSLSESQIVESSNSNTPSQDHVSTFKFNLHTPLSSSPLTSISHTSSSHHSAHTPKIHERPTKRFKSSSLTVNLTPSCTDAYLFAELENTEDEGNRYRTRSKLRSLRAEIEAHEKEEDLRVIRNYLKKYENKRTKKSERDGLVADSPVLKEASLSHALADKNGAKSSLSPLTICSPVDDYKIMRVRKILERTCKEQRREMVHVVPEKRQRGNVQDQNETITASVTLTEAKNKPRVGSSINLAIVVDIPRRTFPESIPINDNFQLFYRRFPLCSYLDPQLNNLISPSLQLNNIPGGHFNTPRSVYDLYTPRFVKGVGRDKVGLCPICYEPKSRGGAGKAEWLSMKFSAFKCYHMQYAHGISPISTRPFSPPIAFRTVRRQANHKNEKTEIMEGRCHKCHNWAPVEGVKSVEAKAGLKEIYWWKHTSSCHKGFNLEGETDIYYEDEAFQKVNDMVKNVL